MTSPPPTSAAVTVGLLGPLQATSALGSAKLGGPRQRSVLAMLALAAPEVVSVDRLVDGVWGETPPENPKSTLQVFVHHLRKALASIAPPGSEPAIASRAPGYVLHPAVACDLAAHTELRRRADEAVAAGDHAQAAALLDEALALWRGPGLSDLRDLPFAEADAARLDEELLLVREDSADLALALGEHESLVPGLEEQVRLHPTRERLWGQLMVALYRSHRQSDALKAYGRARDHLAEELGIDPGEALRQLEVAILRQDPTLTASVGAPAAAPRPAARPPTTLTETIGRDRQLDDLEAVLVGGTRLVTLTGVGGTGKTRLATEIAHRASAAWPGGCLFVPLDQVTDPGAMVRTLHRHLLPHEPQPADGSEVVDRLGLALGTEPVLLVLDNLEQVPDAGSVVRRLLAASSGLTVLATSRLPLRLDGEHEWPVGPLEVAPGTDGGASAAARLFCARARAASREFDPDDADLRTIDELCAVLDGLPLAIELAAARAAVLRPAQLLAHLRDGIDLLATTSPHLPDRHRTMAGTIRWSLDQLSEGAVALARVIALTDGPFTIEAAEELGRDLPGVGSVLEALSELLGASVVRSVPSRVELRFELLRTAAVMLRADPPARPEVHLGAFARWLATLAGSWRDELSTATAELALGRYDDEQAHLVACLGWAVEQGDSELAADLADATHDYWIASGQATQGLAVLAALQHLPDGPPLARARCLTAQGKLAYHADDDSAEDALREALALLETAAGEPGTDVAGVTATRSAAQCYLGGLLVVTDRVDEGRALAEAALEAARAHALYEVQAVGLSMVAIAAGITGDLAQEKAQYGVRLRLVRERGDRARTADTLNTLAEIALDEDDPEAAREWTTESLSLAGDRFPPERRDATISLARVQVLEGRVVEAATTLRDALRFSLETGQRLALAQTWRVAACLCRDDDARTGVRLLAAAQMASPSPTGSIDPPERDLALHLDRLRDELGPKRFDSAWTSGAALGVDGANALVDDLLHRLAKAHELTPSASP